MTKFQTTWVWVRNTTGCPTCGAKPGEQCISKFGRRTQRLHFARRDAHVAANR